MKKVRQLADKNNSLLILDEIVTGFRFDLEGGQKYFGIKGDLVCFGKGMGNGLPISAITGPSEFMKIFDELWVSSTNNSESLSIEGTIGTRLFEGWNKITDKHNLNIKVRGYPIRMTIDCYDSKNKESISLKTLLLQEMVKKGIFISPGVSFISYSHSIEDVDNTLHTLDEVCGFLNGKVSNEDYERYLEGNPPKKTWTMKIPSIKKLNK